MALLLSDGISCIHSFVTGASVTSGLVTVAALTAHIMYMYISQTQCGVYSIPVRILYIIIYLSDIMIYQ